MGHDFDIIALSLQSTLAWIGHLNLPWFIAGAGLGVPAGIVGGTTGSSDARVVSLITAAAGILGGAIADHLASKELSYLDNTFTCFDVLTRAVGPACLLLVVLNRSVRCEQTVAVKPAASVAFAALLLEPVFSAYVLGHLGGAGAAAAAAAAAAAPGSKQQHALHGISRALFGRNRKRDASAAAAAADAAALAAAAVVSRARWLTAAAQVALWIAVILAYARVSLRLSAATALGVRRAVGGYMSALCALAAKKRGNGGWVRIDQWGPGGNAPKSPVPRGEGGVWVDGLSRARAHSLLGSLYERLAGGGGRGGGVEDPMALCGNDKSPQFDRGEVTVRGIRCAGLDAAITGRPSATVSDDFGSDAGASGGNGGGGGADGGGGVAGGKSRPFYVTITLGSVTARTSVRTGFAPAFTEVFPFGCDCPVRGAYLVIAVVDSYEAGRSRRGDRVVGEVHLPLEAAQLVHDDSDDPRPSYRLSGDWELQGILGSAGEGARVGADVVVRGPPSPTSAAGRLRRRRESVGWYAR